jgi:hypothetical protein
MFREHSWIFICWFVILAITITGICLAVTPAAAAAPQISSITYSSSLATTLHNQDTHQAAPAALTSSQPSTDRCLLCYSPSHNLLSRLSEWMGKQSVN